MLNLDQKLGPAGLLFHDKLRMYLKTLNTLAALMLVLSVGTITLNQYKTEAEDAVTPVDKRLRLWSETLLALGACFGILSILSGTILQFDYSEHPALEKNVVETRWDLGLLLVPLFLVDGSILLFTVGFIMWHYGNSRISGEFPALLVPCVSAAGLLMVLSLSWRMYLRLRQAKFVKSL